MSKPLITIEKNASVLEAAKLMVRKNIGGLVVVNKEGRHVGILTERDIVNKVVSKELDCKKIPVSDVMTTDMITVDTSATVLDVTKLMTQHGFRRLIVLENGKPEGIITAKDVIQLYSS
jgi:CBS domain-containing protein